MSLLNEILDRIEFERLIEEGKDPVEVLHYKYQNVPSTVIDKLAEIDPTKKKSFSQWVLSKWNEEKDTIVNNLNNGRIEKLFNHYKAHNDIQIKDCPSVSEGLRMFVPEEDTVLIKSSKPTTTLMNDGWTKEVPSELANDFDVVFNEDDWIIAVPNTYEADSKLGENMRWCTAGGRTDFEGGRSYFNHYLNDYGGKYYVNFDMSNGESRLGKDYPFTRYQFHFESHQFMDKNDDDVEISDIGMPESAKEFYINEGYDESDFENDEARREHYEYARAEDSYHINDDLYLNTEYDYDYDYTEPDDNTNFYLFSINDDTDPISWEAFPNPRYEDVIVKKEDSYAILKCKDDNPLLAYNSSSGRHYSTWETASINNYIELPDERGIFCIIRDFGEYYLAYCSEDGCEIFKKFDMSDSARIAINEECTSQDSNKWERVFVEVVDGESHSLFALSDTINCIVLRDIPINGKSFFINENGIIEGEFRKYRAYPDGTEQKSPEEEYDFVKKLPNGNFVVTRADAPSDYANVVRPGTNEIILNEWVKEVNQVIIGCYITKTDRLGNEVYAVFGSNGERIGRYYQSISFLDSARAVLVGHDRDVAHLISAEEEKVFAEFCGVICVNKKAHNVIVICKDWVRRIYDYVERHFCFPEFEDIRKVDSLSSLYYYAKLKSSDEIVIFDYKTETIVVRGISKIELTERFTHLYKLEMMNGKVNLFGKKGHDFDSDFSLLLPTDVDEIIKVDDLKEIVIFKFDNKYFVYSYISGKYFVKQNGTDIAPSIDSYSGCFEYTYGRCKLYFKGNVLNGWSIYENGNEKEYGNEINENTPQEVRNLYAQIVGQYSNVKEEFKHIVKRIDEANRLRYNDILD